MPSGSAGKVVLPARGTERISPLGSAPPNGARPKSPPAEIPLMSLKGQYEPVRDEILKTVTRVLDSGSYILGPEVERFEEEFARYVRAARCLGVSSGTQALQMALEAVGVRPGDEVIVPAMTFIATATAATEIGAKPVFVDVDPASATMDPAKVAEKITAATKAIVPVHLYGCPADLDPLLAIARERNIPLVEDCAQAHAAQYKGRAVGGIGSVGCFSFYPTKNLGAAGDAGAIVTQDPKIHEACAMLRNIGRLHGERYRHLQTGHNFRLDEIQAAILRIKLRRLARWTAGRRKAAARYRKVLSSLPLTLPPQDRNGSAHAFHLFVVQTPRRDELAKHLSRQGIGSGVYYPIPLHLQPAYASLGYRRGDFPESERVARDVLALPMYPDLAGAAIDRIGAAIRVFFGQP